MPSLRSRRILRVKTGCLTCRGRKKKCEEQRPICRGCIRNHLECIWPVHPDSPSKRQSSIRDVTVNTSSPQATECASDRDETVLSRDDGRQGSFIDGDSGRFPFIESSRDVDQIFSMPDESELLFEPIRNELIESIPIIQDEPETDAMVVLHRNPTTFPTLDLESFDLLSHYLSKTAKSMGNGSTDSNPFITQLIPLAFSSDLILQLLLTQSAAHRAVAGPVSTQVVAHNYYSKSLGLFRDKVNKFITGNDMDSLILVTGALVLCFTETAKGDIYGAIFDHLSAASSILLHLMARSEHPIGRSLNNFLVEYYTYTATLSMISVNPRYSTQLLLTQEVAHQAQGLVRSRYVGHLCGCWLQLLLLIPDIFELGRRTMTGRGAAESTSVSADDIVTFSELHARIVSFAPDESVHPGTARTGYVFQKAMLLYLLTVLEPMGISSTGKHREAIDGAVKDAMFHVSQIEHTARINTSLCWPLAVIGSCTEDKEIQLMIRTRLQTMLRTITLGNIKETLVLLEHAWKTPLEERSPWTICLLMQEHELWISFA